MLIHLVNEDDDFSHLVEVTDEEYTKLIEPAKKKGRAVDGSTVDHGILDVLVDRPSIPWPKKSKFAGEILRIEMV